MPVSTAFAPGEDGASREPTPCASRSSQRTGCSGADCVVVPVDPPELKEVIAADIPPPVAASVEVSEVPAEAVQQPVAADTEASQPPTVEPEVLAHMTVEAEVVAAAMVTEPDLPPPVPRPRPQAKRKVIAFPRSPETAEMIHRLADPVVLEQARILDVPEESEAFATPYLDGLQFGPGPQQGSGAPADHVELPFRAAAISQRAYAALIDCALVGVATAAFGAVGYKMLPRLIITKPVLLTAVMVPVLFWAIYQYLLTVYAGTTVGLQTAGIRLSSFKGARPKWRDRRTRVLALYFSDCIAQHGPAMGPGGRGHAMLARSHQPDLPCQTLGMDWFGRISRPQPGAPFSASVLPCAAESQPAG